MMDLVEMVTPSTTYPAVTIDDQLEKNIELSLSKQIKTVAKDCKRKNYFSKNFKRWVESSKNFWKGK